MNRRTTRRSGVRTILRATAVAGAAATVLTGCLTPRPRPAPPSTTQPTTTAPGPTTTRAPSPTTPTTARPVPAPGYYAEEARKAAPGTPWFCNAAGDGTPLSGHGNGSHVHPIYEGKTKGPLSPADCATMTAQLDEVLAIVAPWGTRAKGEAAGWTASAEYLGGLGTHHVRRSAGIGSGLTNTTFDLENPTFLVYGGSDPDAPLVGASYGVSGSVTPPTGFAGENDWWHLHKKICLDNRSFTFPPKILAGAEEIPDAECTALGGRNSPVPGGGIWLLHLWMAPPHQYRLDIFASGHNCLLADRIAPDDHPCWEIARRDPALGLPPGAGDDHGGGDHGGGHGH